MSDVYAWVDRGGKSRVIRLYRHSLLLEYVHCYGAALVIEWRTAAWFDHRALASWKTLRCARGFGE